MAARILYDEDLVCELKIYKLKEREREQMRIRERKTEREYNML